MTVLFDTMTAQHVANNYGLYIVSQLLKLLDWENLTLGYQCPEQCHINKSICTIFMSIKHNTHVSSLASLTTTSTQKIGIFN